MPLRQVTSYKSIPYLDGREIVSNVYWYHTPRELDIDERRELCEDVSTIERPIYSDQVNEWSATTAPLNTATGSPGAVDGRFEEDPTFTGSQPHNDNYFAPWVILFQQRVGSRAWVRKYHHVCSAEPTGDLEDLNGWFWPPAQQTGPYEDYSILIVQIELTSGSEPAVNAILSTPSDNRTSGPLNIDRRVRVHELKY